MVCACYSSLTLDKKTLHKKLRLSIRRTTFTYFHSKIIQTSLVKTINIGLIADN